MLEQYEQQFLDFIQREMKQDLAHDINHVLRVVKTAKSLCDREGGIMEIVVPAAYLHDCFSFPKHHPEKKKSSQLAAQKANDFLSSIGYPQDYLPAIYHAIEAHSFSANIKANSLEAKIVQDADRLDALGAIGIARCIQVNSSMGVGLYQADDPFCASRLPDDKSYAIDHFYVKLLKLKDTMHTHSAQLEAQKRTEFMQLYLQQLDNEI